MKTLPYVTILFMLTGCSAANAQLSATSSVGGTLSISQDRTTTVIPGSYTCVNETVDATGRATSISNGSCSGSGGSGRTLLTANIDEYFNCSTGINTNSGTSASPFADPAYAYALAQRTIDLGGYAITVHAQANCEPASATKWLFSGPLIGSAGPASFVIEGVVGSPAMITLQNVNFQSINDCAVTVAYLNCNPGTANNCFTSSSRGEMAIHDIWFTTDGAGTLLDAAGTGSIIYVGGGMLLSSGGGNANSIIVSETHSEIDLDGAWAMNGSPTWNNAFVQADLGGLVDATGFSYSGSAVGPRANAISNGVVNTNGSGQGLFPGSINGSVNNGGLLN